MRRMIHREKTSQISIEICDGDLNWLSGWLEGEGSFFLVTTNSKYTIPRIKAGSTDLDVLERVYKLMGPPCKISIQNRHRFVKEKPFYCFHVSGQLALMWMEKLYPLMGNRRQKQIYTVLTGYTSNSLQHFDFKRAANITLETAREIRRLYNETNMTQTEIGRLFELRPQSVSKIVNNHTYREPPK